MREPRSACIARTRSREPLVPLAGGWTCLAVAAILALFPVSQATPPQERKTPEAEAADAENRAIETLIDTLVLFDVDVEGKFYKEGVIERIESAADKLHSLGKKSWPVLFRHLDDRRPSIPAAQVSGPYTVGQQCYHILRGQIVSYPKGYPPYKGSHADDLDGLFKPNLKEWLEQRMDKPLEEIRIETVEYVLKREKADPKPDQQAIELLERHLVALRKRISPPPPPPPPPPKSHSKPSLSSVQLNQALAYAKKHPAEIAAALRTDTEA